MTFLLISHTQLERAGRRETRDHPSYEMGAGQDRQHSQQQQSMDLT